MYVKHGNLFTVQREDLGFDKGIIYCVTAVAIYVLYFYQHGGFRVYRVKSDRHPGRWFQTSGLAVVHRAPSGCLDRRQIDTVM